MKKILFTSVMAMTVVTGARASTYIGNPDTPTADWAQWLTTMPGETAAAVNNLAAAVNANAAEFDNVHQVVADWNDLLFGEDHQMTSDGLFYSYYRVTRPQVKAMAEDVATLSDNIDTMSNDIDTISGNMGNLVANLNSMSAQFAASLSDGMSDGFARIDNLSGRVDKLSDHVEHISKELSAGIANVAALSAVAVSDVKQGEVSLGGGYGYHNARSAVAFGGAMGITDWWSMNAGVGFSDYDVTVRAGTNVKFKLF